MIYLAQPYSHPEPTMQAWRYREACHCCAWLFNRGDHVYSPIVHWHEIASRHELPTDAFAWQKENQHFLTKANRVYVLWLAGWEQSRGLHFELTYALTAGLPVYTLERTGDSYNIVLRAPQYLLKQMDIPDENNSKRGPGRANAKEHERG